MKKLLPLLLALAAPLPAFAAGGYAYSASPIVFNGLIVQDGKTKVSLYNPNTGDAKWVVVGKQFGTYTVGFQPATPGNKDSKDMVILTSAGGAAQRIPLQDASNLSTNTSAVASGAVTTAAASAAARLDALNRQLADARNDPNTNPQLLQALEQTIQRQQQQLATGSAVNVGFTAVNDAATVAARVSTVTGPDGTRTTTTYDANGQVTSVRTQSANANAATPATSGLAR
jgi:YD repeat-containing protein